MPEIILTDDQVRVLKEARGNVTLRDPQGDVLWEIDPVEAAIIARWRQQRGQPRQPGIPGYKVQEHLKALEAEWERTGGFDEAYARAYLAKLRDQDRT